MTVPTLLRGTKPIAERLGISSKAVEHMHRQRQIPTFTARGTMFATVAALDDWLELSRSAKLPIQ